MIPKKVNPVSSPHIPKIPPKDAIWSDQVYLAFFDIESRLWIYHSQTPIGQRSTKNFKSLSENDRKCKLDDELDENSMFKIYTKANCMYECEIDMAYKACQCIPWDFFHLMINQSDGVAKCDAFGRTCFQDTPKTRFSDHTI